MTLSSYVHVQHVFLHIQNNVLNTDAFVYVHALLMSSSDGVSVS